MKQKGEVIQIKRGVITDMISHLTNLPELKEGPDDPLSLPEIFRTKAFMTEIHGALKKGYTFEDLSEIFSEKCGVTVTTRQLKYHYTRGKKKSQKKQLSPPKPTQQENSTMVEAIEEAPLTVPEIGAEVSDTQDTFATVSAQSSI